jgi:translation elongation factor EF-1beta
MATYDLRQKTNASTGQKIVPSSQEIRIQNLENKVNSQSEKLDKIVELLDGISKEKSTT